MGHSDQCIVKDKQGQEQPADKHRAQADPRKSASREATRDPELSDAEKTGASGMVADDRGGAPTG